ncbi:UDP-N-acetylmuramate dehydrogenase [Sedimentibacter sp. zth1]|uniref:UDP-N-acetylmuramate dehydrogenase n=1 Tax=Sedimentibacter sp. zth1 TaxID=2816908 RepID=UPI001A91AA09|nr:UDP-N-acetylmuramate dehydrogenase [Sedimentibacter sp. zth1]QSX05313.1 UDP-N-acetylmuramate dehydrogenase [Sedimentibacter sp. zth1]
MGLYENYEDFYKELSLIIDSKIIKNEELKKHIFFKVGGNADFFIEPKSYEDLSKVLKLVKKYDVNYYIIGNGTNLLVSDKGFRGSIIKIGGSFCDFSIEDNVVKVQSGALLSMVAKNTAAVGLKGLEFACGIPGFIGGGVAMNAGAYNGEIKDVVTSVVCMDTYGDIKRLSKEEMKFGYRNSVALTDNMIVLEVEFTLEKGNKTEILNRIKLLNEKRTKSQPLNYPSAGSTFKRPEGDFAARLIEKAGMKGFSHGGAMVSDKHSGFVINYNNASCVEILELMDIIVEKVYEDSSIKLEPEVRIIGEF